MDLTRLLRKATGIENPDTIEVSTDYVYAMHDLMVRSQRVLRYLGDEGDYSKKEILFTFEKLKEAIDEVQDYSKEAVKLCDDKKS